jgi:hypothetical protein
VLLALRSFLHNRRLRRNTRRLMEIGFTSSEAWQIAESSAAFVKGSRGLVEAIRAADAWCIRMALNTLLDRADLAQTVAQQIEERIPPEWRRLQTAMPPAAGPSHDVG